MSLPRKDVRAKLPPRLHAALKVICKAEGITEGEFIERVISPVIERRIYEATLIAASCAVAGIGGKVRE